ncbi:hypothetical protein FS837_002409, partial [Tulasnella sp. UAMH 9824]
MDMETQASSPSGSISRTILNAEVPQLPVDDRLSEIGQEAVPLASLFLQLPQHLIHRISSHLNITEIISLLVTCQHFRQILEPIVYQHLRPAGDWKTWRRLRLFKTLQEQRHLLPYIQSFRGLLIPTDGARPYEPSEEVLSPQRSRKELIRNEWLASAAPLYAQAINIRDLEFTDYMGWDPNGSWKVFKNMVSNMKLDRLAFISSSDGVLDFTPVLRGQPELTKLELCCFAARFERLEDTVAPNLKLFKGTLKQAAAIVPGRPVERLEAVCPRTGKCECLDEDVYRKLSQSSKAINILELQPHSHFNEETIRGMLRLAVRYLPRMLELTINAETYLSVQMAPSDNDLRFNYPVQLAPLSINMGTPALYSAESHIPTTELPNEQQVVRRVRRGVQQDSKLARTPCEVLLHIISQLDMAEKAYLLATCQYLRQLVEPILYRCLGPDDTWKSHRRIRLLKTLDERQDLLPFIRSFHGLLIPTTLSGPHYPLEKLDERDIWPNENFQNEWFAIAMPLFKQAINIRDLNIMGVMDWGKNGSWEQFEEVVSNMKLNSLALNSSSGGQQDFTPLLRGQPELTRLELDCPTAQFEGLRTENVPLLTVFEGTLSQAAMIVPGRP